MNLGSATRKANRRCENPACGAWFRPTRPTSRYCSRPCAAVVRPRSERMAQGRKGGLAGSAKRREASAARIGARVESLTALEAFRLGRRYGLADQGNVKQAGWREGYAAGFEACIAAMEDEA